VSGARGVAGAVAGQAGGAQQLPLALIGILALVFAALLIVALLVMTSLQRDTRSRLVAAQIDRYGPRHATAPEAEDAAVARTATGLVSRVLQAGNAETGLAGRLDLAALARSPAEWALLSAAACALIAMVLTVLTGTGLLGIPAGILGGWLTMRTVLNTRIRRRRNAFRDQLPDVLQLVAGSLRSGFSLPQALGAVVREDTQPSAAEFSRALAETRIGIELETALDQVAARMDSTDLRWMVMAIRIQREVGGNLAEVLRNTVATMRERSYLHRHVRSLSAEGRLSAYVLIALPILLGAWLFLTDRAYLSPLYSTPLGIVVLFFACGLFVIGVLWMRAVIKVEV
jgi:Flp pilus assembly protein TadB